MALDLIKEYLVGIGFKVDNDSFDKTEKSIDEAGEKINQFNKDSSKGFTETNGSLKDLFSVLGSSKSFTKLFPDAQGPLTEFIEKLNLLKSIYKEINESDINLKKDIPTNDNKKPFVKRDLNKEDSQKKYTINEDTKFVRPLELPKNNLGIEKIGDVSSTIFNNLGIEKFSDASKMLQGNLGNLKNVSKSLLVEGGGAIKNFVAAAKNPITMLVVTVVSAIVAIKKLGEYLGELANKEIGYEKLSKQLWTTKENAKEIDSALKMLDASMEDLWLSPTLLKQFNELREDMKEMRLPPEFQDNIKVIQGIGLEFKRLKQIASMLFEWIGHYILEYIAGPLDETRQGFGSFNDWLKENIPKIAKVIGTIIGVMLRILMIVGKVIGLLWKITSPIRVIFEWIGKLFKAFDSIPEPLKNILKLIGVIALAMLTGPIGAIIAIIAVIDDLFTFIKGGDSVIGDLFDKFKLWGEGAFSNVGEKFSELKDSIKDGMSSLSDSWDNYWDKASETLENIREKAREVWADIKEWASGKWEGFKDKVAEWFPEGKENVLNLNSQIEDGSGGGVTKSYMSSNNTSNNVTSNTSNNVSNVNNITVHGTDPVSTGREIGRNLTNLQTRNVQGVL